jgi:hypothetical protein
LGAEVAKNSGEILKKENEVVVGADLRSKEEEKEKTQRRITSLFFKSRIRFFPKMSQISTILKIFLNIAKNRRINNRYR